MIVVYKIKVIITTKTTKTTEVVYKQLLSRLNYVNNYSIVAIVMYSYVYMVPHHDLIM